MDVGDSGDGIGTDLPSFGSHNGGETLRAAIIHYKSKRCLLQRSCGSRVYSLNCISCPKASHSPVYIGIRDYGLHEILTDIRNELVFRPAWVVSTFPRQRPPGRLPESSLSRMGLLCFSLQGCPISRQAISPRGPPCQVGSYSS